MRVTFVRLSYGWLVPTLGTLALVHLSAVTPLNRHLQLRNQAEPYVPSGLPSAQALPGVSNRPLALIQFTGPLRAEWRQQLEAAGVRLLRYVPDDAFVARFLGSTAEEVRSLPFIRSLGAFGPTFKLDSRLSALHPSRVRVLLAPDVDARQLVQVRRILQGFARHVPLRHGGILEGELRPDSLGLLAASDVVLWVEPAPKMQLCDEIASKIVGGDDGAAGTQTVTQQLGFDGRGVSVAVADSGLQNGETATMHPDLAGRVDAFFYYGELENAADEHSHGTHVTGIIAGDGAAGERDENGFLYGLGVAPGAHVVVQRLFDGLGGYQAPRSFGDLTRDAVQAGADIGSNSWGDDTQGRYDLSAAEFDALVRDADTVAAGSQPYILEFSAGNAGPAAQTIGSPAVGKNVIATGATQNDRSDFIIYGEGPEWMADFSSRGPCEDGRIKPDVVAPGTWIASLKSAAATDENAWSPISELYMYQGGTSQAGPHVSGAAAVFVQYYRETHVGTTPSPALVKAALIDSAVDLDDTLETDPVPNRDEGWGRVDLTRLIGAKRRVEFLDQSQALSAGQVAEHRVVVASEAEPLRITLVYTDVEGFPAALPALVNDLDLEVEAPDGTRFGGNQFVDGESLPNPAAADRLNNVECVRLAAPAPGEYVIRVRTFNVVADARADTPAVDQDFAMVVSGDLPIPGEGVLYFDRGAYTTPDLAQLKLIDPDLAGQPSVTVTVRSTTEPAGETVELGAIGAAGVFTNRMAIVTGSAVADGQLQVAHGDLLEATYNDASPVAVRTAAAVADLQPPVITGVNATNAFGRVVVQWTTDEPATSEVRFGLSPPLTNRVVAPQRTDAHAVTLEGLLPGTNYFYLVSAIDEAGNGTTNDNNGQLYQVVARAAKTVLLVNAYEPTDPTLELSNIPLSDYTTALDQTGLSYEVWEVADLGSPGTNDLRPYRVVFWRLNEDPFADQIIEAGEQATLESYVRNGGALLVTSMELLTGIQGSPFVNNVLQIQSFTEDAQIPSIAGVPADPLAGDLAVDLDYLRYDSALLQFLSPDLKGDVADTVVPTANALAFLLDAASGEVAGLRSPKNPLDPGGRVVFLGFPLDVVPEAGTFPNNRAGVLRACLAFLAPGADGLGTVTLDRAAYALPSLVTVEVGDSDLRGQGQVQITVTTDTATNGITATLRETGRPGTFRGTVGLVPSSVTPTPDEIQAADGDAVRIVYLDASAGHPVVAVAQVDTQPPVATNVVSAPDYESAVIAWETSEPAEGLVQFSESAFLDNERTLYEGVLGEYHELTLTNLAPDQLYFYKVTSRDAAGNSTVTTDGGVLFTFRTLTPLVAPWSDALEAGATNWTVFDSEETVSSWQLGPPNNGAETSAHSPTKAWGSNLDGQPLDMAESFLISPAIQITGGNVATLRFWHSYDFTARSDLDILEGGEVLLFTNNVSPPVTLATYADDLSAGWTEEEFDLSPYVGRVVYVVWHYLCLSLDAAPRPGWLLDDVSVGVATEPRGTLVVSNNLAQAQFTVTGPLTYSGVGTGVTLTNVPFGSYTVTFAEVPFYLTPASQTQTIDSQATVPFSGVYAYTDVNHNGMSDTWEQQVFGSVDPARTPDTDTDLDGATDAGEFAAGTDPNNAKSTFVARPPVVLGDDLRFQWSSVPGRAYRWEATTDFLAWTAVTDWRRAEHASSVVLLPVPTGVGHWMYRLVVQP